MEEKNNNQDGDEGLSEDNSSSLENNTTSIQDDAENIDATGDSDEGSSERLPEQPRKNLLQRIKSSINIYLLLMIGVLLIASAIVLLTYLTSKKNTGTSNLSSSSLTENALQQLASSDTNASVGNTNQVLTVQSSSIFAGKVLIRQDLEVAGNLTVGNTLTINGISVSGTAQIGQLDVSSDESVGGNDSIQGSVTVGKGIQVNGPGLFSGQITAPQITTPDLQISGDLVLTHHLVTGGSAPKSTSGNALGLGGTTSISGDDTAGSININTGASPIAGCFATINFSTSFNTTPHVLITPIGSYAASVGFYVNRSSKSFSICGTVAAPQNVNFGFDYFVAD